MDCPNCNIQMMQVEERNRFVRWLPPPYFNLAMVGEWKIEKFYKCQSCGLKK